jgi:hypothetical protein
MSEIGRFRIQIRIRVDNPAFPQYLIYCGMQLIGKQFSVPTLSDCEWLERQATMDRLVYAEVSARLYEHSIQSIGGVHRVKRYKFPRLDTEEESI